MYVYVMYILYILYMRLPWAPLLECILAVVVPHAFALAGTVSLLLYPCSPNRIPFDLPCLTFAFFWVILALM
jgi:hypothetical protein